LAASGPIGIHAGVINDRAMFAGAELSPTCAKTEDCPFIPGSTPPTRSGCDVPAGRCATWSCQTRDGGPVATGALLCSWAEPSPSPSPTATPKLPPALPPSDSDDGCAVVPANGSNGTLLLTLFAAALIGARRRAR
jgi:MYXO-CTERM domain-containing protein